MLLHKNLGLSGKILITGLLLSLAPTLILITIVLFQNSTINQSVEKSTRTLVDTDLDHLVTNAYHIL
jgi:hypothetical protein